MQGGSGGNPSAEEGEPSYRGIQWEASFEESFAELDMPDRVRHDIEMASEWKARRLADRMDKPSDGLEVMKLFGDPPLRAFWRLNDDGSISLYWIEEDPDFSDGEGGDNHAE